MKEKIIIPSIDFSKIIRVAFECFNPNLKKEYEKKEKEVRKKLSTVKNVCCYCGREKECFTVCATTSNSLTRYTPLTRTFHVCVDCYVMRLRGPLRNTTTLILLWTSKKTYCYFPSLGSNLIEVDSSFFKANFSEINKTEFFENLFFSPEKLLKGDTGVLSFSVFKKSKNSFVLTDLTYSLFSPPGTQVIEVFLKERRVFIDIQEAKKILKTCLAKKKPHQHIWELVKSNPEIKTFLHTCINLLTENSSMSSKKC